MFESRGSGNDESSLFFRKVGFEGNEEEKVREEYYLLIDGYMCGFLCD